MKAIDQVDTEKINILQKMALLPLFPTFWEKPLIYTRNYIPSIIANLTVEYEAK